MSIDDLKRLITRCEASKLNMGGDAPDPDDILEALQDLLKYKINIDEIADLIKECRG